MPQGNQDTHEIFHRLKDLDSSIVTIESDITTIEGQITALENFVDISVLNGFSINTVIDEKITNSTNWAKIGGGILNFSVFISANITHAYFMVASGNVATGGLDVRLFDKTNAIQICSLNFTSAQSNTIKSYDFKSYLTGKSGNIQVEVQHRKAGAVGPSYTSGSTLYFIGD